MKGRRRWQVTVVAGLVMAVLLGSPSGAAFYGLPGKISFDMAVMKGQDVWDWDVFTANADGSDVRNFSDAGFFQGDATWSPDGRRLAYASDSGLIVMDVERRVPRLLVRNRVRDGQWSAVWQPSWSPDGTRIAFSWVRYDELDDPSDRYTADGTEAAAIKVVKVDGSDLKTIVPEGDRYSMQPSWSPDGSLIVFTRYLPGNSGSTGENDADVWVVEPGGEGLERIASKGWNQFPSWTSEGHILYATERDCPEVYICTELQTMDRTGKPIDRVTTWPHDWTGEGEPDYLERGISSPNGRYLLVELEPYHRTFMVRGPNQLWLVDTVSGGRTMVAESEYEIGKLDWGPTCTLQGTPGDDVLRGTPGRDLICGLGGDDVIRGLGGNDSIFGHGGDDRIVGGAGADIVVGNAGRDLCDRDVLDFSRVC